MFHFAQSMISCNSSLPKFALLDLTESSSKTSVACNISKLTEVKEDYAAEEAIFVQATFPCELALHTAYDGTLYLFGDTVINETYLGVIPGLTLSK